MKSPGLRKTYHPDIVFKKDPKERKKDGAKKEGKNKLVVRKVSGGGGRRLSGELWWWIDMTAWGYSKPKGRKGGDPSRVPSKI